MNKVKRLAIAAATSAIIFGTLATSAFAAAPVQPNCLGADVSGFAQALGGGFGGFISGIATTTPNGVGDEFLAHKQGVPSISTCPDNGFPTPLL